MMMKRISIPLLIFFLHVSVCIGAEGVVYKITFLGNVKVEEGVIRGAIKSREGRAFSVEQVREDLRSIFALGFFSDVQVDIQSTPKGEEVIFIVMEKPSIKGILITGNQKVKLDDIKEKVTLTPRSILNLEKVKENSEQIRKLYFSKGYFGVNVEYKMDYLETNEVMVTFKIVEGVKGHIQKILFKGNQSIKSSALKKVMATKEKTILYLITKTGILDEDILKNDHQLLTAYYIDHGYLDVKVSDPKIDLRDPRRIRIETEITEGPQYRLGEVDFKGDILTTREDLFKVLRIKRNNIYRNSVVRKEVNALTEKYANQGFAYVEILPVPAVDSKNLLVHLTFQIEKNKRVSFDKIQLVGNTKTREKVIRRELRVAEGELYSATGLRKSRDRLKRTGFFKEVEFTTSQGSTDEKINLDIKVEETPTGSLSFGIGYGTIEKAVASAILQDRNLFGLGYHGLLSLKLGFDTQEFRLGFTDPYFLGYPYSAGIDLYQERVEIFNPYSYRIIGGDIRFGKELTENIRLDGMYKLEKVNVYNVTEDASEYIKEQKGKKTTSALSFSLSMDTRDEYYAPTRGEKLGLLFQNAGGPLGGSNYFFKVIGETSWFFPMPLKTVLNLRGKIGLITPYGGKEVPIYEKFYVGGINTIRGFEYGMAGPLDEYRQPIGANKILVFTSELLFPISREIGLRGAVFWDIGKGFDKFGDMFPLKTGIGVGLRWYSPFGPIRIDLGFNPLRKAGEKSNVLDFAAGTAF